MDFNRFLQYASKFSGWYVEKSGLEHDLIKNFNALENSFSATRKGKPSAEKPQFSLCGCTLYNTIAIQMAFMLFRSYGTFLVAVLRLGKSIDLLVGAYNSLAIRDIVVKIALVLAKINQAVYLIVDHKVWLIKLGVLKGDAKPYAKLAAKFWLVTIIFNLVRNLHDILTIVNRHKSKVQNENKTSFGEFIANKPMFVDTVKNVSDVFLPLAGLNYINISVGLQGVLGMLSSVMAMLQSWDVKYKLTPA